jgi:hypothetical protein
MQVIIHTYLRRLFNLNHEVQDLLNVNTETTKHFNYSFSASDALLVLEQKTISDLLTVLCGHLQRRNIKSKPSCDSQITEQQLDRALWTRRRCPFEAPYLESRNG